MILKYIGIISAAFLLSGCSTWFDNRPQVNVTTPSQNIEIIQPKRPAPLDLRDVEFKSYDRSQLVELVSDTEFKAIVGITPQEFKKLSQNIEDTTEYIEIQNAIIAYYEATTKDIAKRPKSKDDQK